MSRDEADEPVDGGEHTESGRTPDPSPHFTVVISGDGSAAIDGEPVQVAEGEAVDAAILDTLHGHARDRGITVTAAISDPAAGYVAFVEVSPDGSSSLLEQQQEPEASAPVPAPAPSLVKGDALDDADDDGPAGGTGPAVAPGVDAHEEAHDDFDEAAYALPEPEGPPPPPPSDGPRAGAGAGAGSGPEPGAGPGAGVGRGRGLGWDSGSGSASRSESATRPVPPPKPARRTASRQSDDAFEGPGLLSRPLVVGPVALGVAALVVVPLVILGSGGSDGGGNQEQAAARASSSPSAEVSPTLETPPRPTPPPPGPTSASPSAEPKDKDKDKDKSKAKDKNKPQPKPTYTPGAKSGGRVTVTVTATPPKDTTTVTAKPPQDTAASAVKRLAGNDPSGRHICYRAYVAGQGWQKPVCDGTIAGTSGQNRPIKALNIAVHGVDGSAANAFRHSSKPVDGRGEWEPSWTAITGDGKNFYIGSSKRNAPNMLGFAINVGSGEVCHAVRLRQGDWAQRTCSKPRPDYTFGGTLDNDVWLEAVKFTV
ncbi:hypothetical protein OH738_18680 [Streptomyces hirsutus]|uniref:hypothetical protein n=1 Tax=Streptomyces hirsutus TaxID=35620 RepID=UPI0038699B55|nr:hypothetical protein OH738_18680 [Streptomyces hirsutus]